MFFQIIEVYSIVKITNYNFFFTFKLYVIGGFMSDVDEMVWAKYNRMI